MNAGRIGRLLVAILAFGLIGTLVELVLLGHYDGWQQWVPLVLLTVGLPIVLALLIRPTVRMTAVLKWLMFAWLISGLVGVWLHYRGNVEFAQELSPGATGWELFREAVSGATPSLAPGTMVWFALVGLVAVRLLAIEHSKHSRMG